MYVISEDIVSIDVCVPPFGELLVAKDINGELVFKDETVAVSEDQNVCDKTALDDLVNDVTGEEEDIKAGDAVVFGVNVDVEL